MCVFLFFEYVAGTLIFTLLGLTIVGFIVLPFYFLYHFALFKLQFNKRYTPRQKQVIRVILEKHNPYFTRLGNQGKGKFLKRLLKLMNSFEFVGKGLTVNTEMKALVCSAIAQVTFGWREYDLDRFHQIQIYPDVFRLHQHLPKMQGASHPRGILIFSWKHLQFGYAIEDDGINLALHEVAHAVKINYLDNGSFWLPNKRYEAWKEQATVVKLEYEMEAETFFRKRATKNEHEFFAICIENFFERPKGFLDSHPKLFAATCLLLNQNPLHSKKDYKV